MTKHKLISTQEYKDPSHISYQLHSLLDKALAKQSGKLLKEKFAIRDIYTKLKKTTSPENFKDVLAKEMKSLFTKYPHLKNTQQAIIECLKQALILKANRVKSLYGNALHIAGHQDANTTVLFLEKLHFQSTQPILG